jgi:hypothetical protein
MLRGNSNAGRSNRNKDKSRYNDLNIATGMFPLKTFQSPSLTISIAVVIISAYSQHIIDIAIQYSLPPVIADAGMETEGLAKIYPTKKGGDEWFMGPNLKNDTRFDASANLSRNQDGSWSVNSTGQATLNIWTRDSGDFRDRDGMVTYNHSIIEARGYWYRASDWKNVEMTGYFKLNDYAEDEYTTYSRSIWHNSTHNGCGGSDYKLRLNFGGSVSFDKEEWHVNYSEQPKSARMPEHKIVDGLGNLTNKWIGLKSAVYNIQQNGTSYPKLEMWIDQNNNNTWKKIHEYVDKGGWGSTMNRCGGAPDQLITWGSPVVTFRWDDTVDVDFRNLSVREIQPRL